jgi:cobaltochelatase CobN
MSNEVRTRLLNPKWIEGMLNEGFSGANHIASEIGHLVAWDAVTPDAVADWIYQKTAETYFLDSTVRNQFLNANPYAFASAAAWLLEANRRGLWAADSATISQLKDMYMNTIRKYGVVCCHHTCGNMDFTNYVVVGSTLSQKQLQEFAAIMEAATGQTVTMGSTGTPSQSTGSTSAGATSSAGTSSGSQPSTESGAQSESESAETAGDDGTSKSYEVSETGQQSSAQSSMPIAAIVGVLILVSLVGLGYFRGAIFKK